MTKTLQTSDALMKGLTGIIGKRGTNGSMWQMSHQTSADASEIEDLAAKIWVAAADSTSVVANLTHEFPTLGKVLKILEGFRENLETATSNKEELSFLVHRYTDITAIVITKCRRAGVQMDVGPLLGRAREVERLIERCGRRSRVQGAIKREADRLEISDMSSRIEGLPSDMGLVNIAEDETKHGEPLGEIPNRSQIGHLGRIEEEDKETSHDLLTSPPVAARIPDEAPTLRWHLPRESVMQTLLQALSRNSHPQVVGLVGESGSGKTTAASEFVRKNEVRELFSDGILWLTVNNHAKDRLSSLMWKLANIVHDHIMDGMGRAPAASDNYTSYVRKQLHGSRRGRRRRYLVVGDNVWEAEVISKLRELGVSVLVTTRSAELIAAVGGMVVELGEFSELEAMLVLRVAAELATEKQLPEAAIEVVELCGRAATDLCCVGRWSTLRGQEDSSAWSDAAVAIREELARNEHETDDVTPTGIRAEQRTAILGAGVREIARVDDRARRLYLALAVMPDGHAFSVSDAALLLNDGPPSERDVSATIAALATLESRSVLGAVGEGRKEFRMHDAHSDFARNTLKDHVDVRHSAMRAWVEHLSSLETLASTDVYVLIGMWDAVELIRGDDERLEVGRPYEVSLSKVDQSNPVLFREYLAALVRFHRVKGDLEGEYVFRQKMLEFEQKTLGPAHPNVLNTLTRLADSARNMQDAGGAEKWYGKAERTSGNVAFRAHDGSYEDEHVVVESLKSLAWSLMECQEWSRAERILLQALEIQEMVRPGSVKVANTLYKLGRCIREAGRKEEAEHILYRAMYILEAKRRPNHWLMVLTQQQLDLCARGEREA